ncbi:MAG: hypothetical protein K2J85_07195, partial [Anaeroplasmataceae bacterium]|nr:hypothetical protein [Anaeroplasmataceae bacterium]
MKKVILFFMLVLGLGLASCGGETKSPNEVNIYMPDGTPALALASVLDEGFTYGESKTTFHIVQAAEIATRVSQDTCDLAIMPTTAAAQLYSKGIKIQLASVNVFGNLYITGTNEISSLEDLKGKVILTTAATTIQMVKYVLDGNNIPYEESGEAVAGKVALSSMNDASDIIPLLKKAVTEGTECYGVLGEPQVTKAQSVVSGLKITEDLQAEYKKLTNYDGYPQACLVVKQDFASTYPDYVKALLKKLEGNSTYLSDHLTALPEVFKKHESNLANMTFTADTITRCNVRLEAASSVKDSVKEYVKALTKLELDDTFFLNE